MVKNDVRKYIFLFSAVQEDNFLYKKLEWNDTGPNKKRPKNDLKMTILSENQLFCAAHGKHDLKAFPINFVLP
jgi:hypothetical protein